MIPFSELQKKLNCHHSKSYRAFAMLREMEKLNEGVDWVKNQHQGNRYEIVEERFLEAVKTIRTYDQIALKPEFESVENTFENIENTIEKPLNKAPVSENDLTLQEVSLATVQTQNKVISFLMSEVEFWRAKALKE